MKNNKDDLLDDTIISKSKEENKKEIDCINLLSSASSASYLSLSDLDNDPFDFSASRTTFGCCKQKSNLRNSKKKKKLCKQNP
jgi:hypothetical protein